MARSKQAAVSDEQIIAALLSNGTVKAAADAVGLSERAVYARMISGEFKALYASAKSDLIRTAVLDINSQVTAAIRTIVEVMSDPKNNAAIRLQAAQTILNNAGKYSERLQASETMVSGQIESNRFRLFS